MTRAGKWKLGVRVLLGAAMLIAAAVISLRPPVRVPYVEFSRMLRGGEIASVALGEGAMMRVTTTGGAEFSTENPRKENYKETLLEQGVEVTEPGANPAGALVAGVLIGGVLWLMLRQQGKGMARKIGGMEAEAAVPTITFDDVAANEEARRSLRGLVDFIKNPTKYAAYGARIPHGVLLYGPPGTGKTMMARALAGEAGVPFYAVSGSDFVQMYVGVGASRVRDLFKKAHKAERAVIFIDEIDALGKKRESQNDEREQTLNALLTEMSGFSANEGVVVLAATNRLDTLDAALLRPGRFDRQLEIGLPGRKERLQILTLHAGNKPMADDVDLEKVAADTVYFSGAMLESMLNEAAIRAAQHGGEAITAKDIADAMQTVLVGEEKAERGDVSLHEKRVTAVHEAAHALITLRRLPDCRLAQVSIIPSTKGAAGYSMAIQPDRMFLSRRELEAHIAVALAGRAAEQLTFGEDRVTTGASNDLQKATELMSRMCLEWGMDDAMGPMARGALAQVSPIGQSEIATMQARLAAIYQQVLAELERENDTLVRIADALEQQEMLTGEQVLAIAG